VLLSRERRGKKWKERRTGGKHTGEVDEGRKGEKSSVGKVKAMEEGMATIPLLIFSHFEHWI